MRKMLRPSKLRRMAYNINRGYDWRSIFADKDNNLEKYALSESGLNEELHKEVEDTVWLKRGTHMTTDVTIYKKGDFITNAEGEITHLVGFGDIKSPKPTWIQKAIQRFCSEQRRNK